MDIPQIILFPRINFMLLLQTFHEHIVHRVVLC